MKNIICIFSITLSVLSIVFSLISLSLSCPKNDSSIDYYAIEIGVLTILFTLLVAWQIFYAINYKETINNITEDFKSKINKNEKKTNDVKGMCYSMCSSILLYKGDYIYAYEYCLYSIRNYVFGNAKTHTIEKLLERMESSLENMSTCSDFEDEVMFYTCLHDVKESTLDEKLIKRLIDLEENRKAKLDYTNR